jgi:hypothetical protein
MTFYLFHILVVSLLSAFIILFLSKTGLRDDFIITSPGLLSEMFSCDFCFSFWTAMIICIVSSVYYWDAYLLLLPFVTTPITRVLI